MYTEEPHISHSISNDCLNITERGQDIDNEAIISCNINAIKAVVYLPMLDLKEPYQNGEAVLLASLLKVPCEF